MRLKVLLPFEVLVDRADVERIVAWTDHGAMGIYPKRLDCVATLAPGILTYQPAGGSELYIAVTEGALVKAGADVLVSVHRAITGHELGQLHRAVQEEFSHFDERQKKVRSVIAKLESGFIKKFLDLHHD